MVGYSMTKLEIEVIKHFSDDLLSAVNSLLPQLTSTGRAMTAAELSTMVASPSANLFIARDKNGIVGMISLAVAQMPTGLRSYLEDLVVDSSYRRHGVATALLQAAIETAKNSGARTLDMTSRSSRAGAIQLYERLGFRRRDTNALRYQFYE
jgi:ribosomal protein S18 acetylase RimI-like enzyme